ncbi:MAG: flagellin [Planctomycetia bacterium]|nr:flagellin [Planctomycetia bacterium]MCC7313805.1 flagellin [Planctomycetota bacterium]
MSRINTNVSALQAITKLIENQNDLNTRLERLSSGLRINRGADDPAGLIASESLRSEIRGITAAIDNSTRAVNVISTADAALGEVSKLLLEVKGLVNASTNSGALSEDEIQANQLQIDSLLESINRVANSTQFNTKKLLNGELGYTVSSQNSSQLSRLQIFGARIPSGQVLPVTIQVTQSAQTAVLGITAGGANGLSSSGYSSTLSSGNNVTLEVRGRLGTEIFTFTGGTTVSSIANTISSFKTLTGVSASISTTGTGSATGLQFNSTSYGNDEFVSVRAISGTFTVAPGDQGDTEDRGRNAGVLVNGQAASVNGLVARIRSSGLDLVVDLATSFGTTLSSSSFGITGGGANFQIGPQVNSDGLISIGIPSITTSNLGSTVDGFLNSIGTGGTAAITDSANHPTAAAIVSSAITQVAILSGRLGGFQANQIETNLNSQRIALENVQASESTIRDTDYASEVSRLTRAQILVQSTTQILGLANQLPQNVLSLLR